MKKEKVCKIHGELLEKDILISQVYKKNNKESIYYKCGICSRARRQKTEKEQQKDQELGEVVCGICKINLDISLFSSGELRRKPSSCKECIKKQNHFRWLQRQVRSDGISFKITNSDYQSMLENQKYVCAICNKPESKTHYITKKPMRLCIDHCHKTGKVRGLLCSNCNIVIGNALDDITILSNAILYLKEELGK